MSSQQQLIDEVACQIVVMIKSKARGVPDANVLALRKLCRHDFGIPARSIDAPDDFYGMVRGDIGGDDCMIVYNENLPDIDKMRVLIHELAEYIAARDISELCERANEAAALGSASLIEPTQLRHLVAVEVECVLSRDMGIDQPRSTWPLADILRVIPLDAKYLEPRDEIEHLPYED